MEFLADVMLQKLGRWLRMLGFPSETGILDDDALIRKAAENQLILLTRDRGLYLRARDYCKAYLVESALLDAQLLEVCGGFRIDLARIPESRVPSEKICSICNGKLMRVKRADAEKSVPPNSFRSASSFRRCASCGKIFWRGSHNAKITAKFRALRKAQKARRQTPKKGSIF